MIAQRLLANAPLQIVQAVLGFATIAAFTRLMAPEQYGQYALLLSFSMLAHTLALTGAEAAAFRFFPRTARGEADHYATLRLFALIAAGVAVCALAAALMLGGAWSVAIACAVGAAFFRFIARLMRETERAAEQVPHYVIAECAYLIVGFMIGLVLLAQTKLGAAAPFAGLMLAGAGLALRDAPALWKRARGGRAIHARAYLHYGAPLAMALALDLFVQAALRFLLVATNGEAAAGAYAAAFGLTRPLDLIFVLFGASFGPLLLAAYEQNGPDAARTRAREGAAMLALLAVPASVGLALVAKPLTNAMIGEGLRNAVAPVVPWLAFAALLNGFALYYFSEAFQLARRTGLRAALMLAPAATQIALAAVLTHTHGAQGAAIAAAFGAALTVVLLAIAGRRLIALPAPVTDFARTGAATILMAGVVLLLPAFGGFVEVILKAVFGAIAFAAAAYALDIAGVRRNARALIARLPLEGIAHAQR